MNPSDLGGVVMAAGPAMVSGIPHTLDVFYRGVNGHLWWSWWPDTPGGQWWSAPADLGGETLGSSPTVVQRGVHQLDVFYRGPNDHLWWSWWPNVPGSPWWSKPWELIELGETVKLTSAPTAVGNAAGHAINVLFRGPDKRLWWRWCDLTPEGPAWSTSIPLGGEEVFGFEPKVVSGGAHTLDVFYRGPNGHLWWSWYDGQWWSAPTDLDPADHTAAAVIRSAPAAVSRGRHTLDVFYRGHNGNLQSRWWPTPDGWWSAPADLDLGLEHDLGLPGLSAVYGAHPGSFDILYRGPNGHLWWWLWGG